MGNHIYVFGVSYTYGIPTLLHTCLTVVALGIGVHPYSQNFNCRSMYVVYMYTYIPRSRIFTGIFSEKSHKSPAKITARLRRGASAASCHGDHGVRMYSSCKAIYGGRLQ